MAAELLLREAYDITYGIFDHVKQAQIEKKSTDVRIKRPLALVEFHPAEDTSGASRFKEAALMFAKLKIHERWGISFLEYLENPHYLNQLLIDAAEELAKSDSKVLRTAMQGLEDPKK
jgi:hypothetical protein